MGRWVLTLCHGTRLTFQFNQAFDEPNQIIAIGRFLQIPIRASLERPPSLRLIIGAGQKRNPEIEIARLIAYPFEDLQYVELGHVHVHDEKKRHFFHFIPVRTEIPDQPVVILNPANRFVDTSPFKRVCKKRNIVSVVVGNHNSPRPLHKTFGWLLNNYEQSSSNKAPMFTAVCPSQINEGLKSLR